MKKTALNGYEIIYNAYNFQSDQIISSYIIDDFHSQACFVLSDVYEYWEEFVVKTLRMQMRLFCLAIKTMHLRFALGNILI